MARPRTVSHNSTIIIDIEGELDVDTVMGAIERAKNQAKAMHPTAHNFTAREDTEDYCDASHLYLSFDRNETPSEKTTRLRREKNRRENIEQNELAMYEKLKKKFEPTNEKEQN